MERAPLHRRVSNVAAAFVVLAACQSEAGELAPEIPKVITNTIVPEATLAVEPTTTITPMEETAAAPPESETTTTMQLPETSTTTAPPETTTTRPQTTTTTRPPETTTTTQPNHEPLPERTLNEIEVAEVQQLLTDLLPIDSLVIDGIEGSETRRRLCLVRQLVPSIGLKPMSMEPASFAELEALRSLKEIKDEPGTDETLFYINTTCKMGALAVGNQWAVVTEIAMGAPGYQQYPNGGRFDVYWMRPKGQLNDGWWTSTLYPDIPEGAKGNMYKPLYFDNSIAVHGSLNTEANDASHGCIRTTLAAQDELIEAYMAAQAAGRPMRIVINDGQG